jgi:CheY-like chemotaxis protein
MEAIGTLAGGIAHDFNNILTGIFGNVELARLDLPPGHPVQLNLDNILGAAKRARDVVSQILTFSRRREQRASVIQLGPVIEEACKLLRASLPPSINIGIEVPANSPPVLADPTQIHQLIINLCTNAVHALGAGGGRVEIRHGVMELDASQARAHGLPEAGKYARVSVSDTGQGMDEVTLKHIFEPFFTTKPPGQGTGLGLAVVHGIMQNHRGGIVVESQPGQGSTFHLFFPVVENTALDAAIPPNPLPSGQGQRILLVDDEPEVARLSDRILQRQGYLVTTFTDPARALAAFRAEPRQFELLLTDFTMPGLTGLQLASAVREIRPDLPVILCTGYRANVDARDTSQAGIKEILGKPFDLQLLVETVHRVLNPPPGAE